MRKFFLIGIIITILLAVPLTVFIINTQRTTTQSGAAPSTILSFQIPNSGATVGTPLAIPITVNPSGAGSTPNKVSFIKVVVQYDGNKLTAAASNYFVQDPKFTPLEGPTNSCDKTSHLCTISATLTTGNDPAAAVSSQATIATLNFNPTAPTDPNSPTQLTFVGGPSGSQALSIASSDTQPAANVLATSRLQPGLLTIVGAPITATPTLTPTPGGSSGGNGGGSSGGSGGPGGSSSSGGGGNTTTPVTCSSFTADNTTGLSAPFTVLFTATGASTNTIAKVDFNFGDGQVQSIASGSGIGTSNVSIQQSHIYNANGTYSATAVFTDTNGNTTTPSVCSQKITIGATTTPTTAPKATPTIPATGPGNTIMAIGAIGVAITVVGVLLAFGL